jgi:predicted lipoprotein
MHRRLLLAAPLVLLAVPARAVPDEGSFRALNRAVVEGAVLPGFRGFAAASGGFATALAALAKAPGEPAPLAAARQAWTEALLAWQAVRPYRFGPAARFSRWQRVQSWPGPGDVLGQALDLAVRRREAGLLDVRADSLSNIATLGLPAAERLLFGPEAAARLAAADAEAAYRAALLGAIGATVAAIGRDLLEGWAAGAEPYAAVMIEPRQPYATPRDATLELLRALHLAVRLVAAPALAEALAENDPGKLENWRSGLSGRSWGAQVAAARQAFRTGFAPALERDGQGALAAELGGGFDRLATAAALPWPAEAALADPPAEGGGRRAALQSLQRQAARLAAQLAEQLAPALGLPSGFDALTAE